MIQIEVTPPNRSVTFGDLEPGDLFRWAGGPSVAVYLRLAGRDYVPLRSESRKVFARAMANGYTANPVEFLGRLEVTG